VPAGDGELSSNGSPPVAVRWAILGVGLCVTSLLFLDLCDLIFACGCEAFWLAAADHCNIHTAGRPDCPWCGTGVWGTILPFGGVVGMQAMAALPSGTGSAAQRLALVTAAFPVVGGLLGLAFGLVLGYWVP
jgi:hypothetical protein